MAQIDRQLVGDTVLEYENRERSNIISEKVIEYIIFCHRNSIINSEDLLILAKYIENDSGAGESRFLFILFDEDEKKAKNYKQRNFEDRVIDLRSIIEKLKTGIRYFDWSKLDGYVRIPINKPDEQNGETP